MYPVNRLERSCKKSLDESVNILTYGQWSGDVDYDAGVSFQR